ncbi:transcription factor-like 5 protein isoform X1 [Solea senegalensis]|uniref:Transcription factor-like 5 protein isoform X1 n=1 Tax=Solea senegalensis TaxID=28829 RepID=A0AAV6SRP8_SOLSE|nr:transcription factor-like 5 protein [Solea senegalensis]KAG7519529.1 transcription factor-like 5 protein isoform X1 [Solea senegalensis]
MSAFSSAHKTTSDLFSDSVGQMLSQGGCLTHDLGQMMGSESSLMKMTEVEYTHLQHLIQTQLEAQAGPPDGSGVHGHPATVMVKDPTASTGLSASTTTQAIDLSTSNELVMQGDKTPGPYGEVPGFVLARITGKGSLTKLHVNSRTSSLRQPRSAVRVRLEKRFKSMSADSPKDVQSVVLSNVFTLFQQSAEAQEAAIHPKMQNWLKTEGATPVVASSPYVVGVNNPAPSMCGQVLGHIPYMVEEHQDSFIHNFCLDPVVTKAPFTSSSNSTEETPLRNIENVVTHAASRRRGRPRSPQPTKAVEDIPDSAGAAGSSTRRTAQSHNQRKEKHNIMERERRKRIRLCCDELKMMVPFCDCNTDKLTTLQRTTAFLSYITKVYGDTFKQEFQEACSDEMQLFQKSRSPLVQNPHSVDLAAEQ